MPPNAPTGVVTHYKKLYTHFKNDPDVHIDLVTSGDISHFQKRIAGFVRRLIYLFSFNNKMIRKLSNDINLKLKILFALSKYKYKNYDIIHAQDIQSGYIAKLFFQRKLPLILTCHFNDTPVEEDILQYSINISRRQHLHEMYKQKFSEVDKFIFVSDYVYKKSRTLLNSYYNNVTVIYNGVDFSSAVSSKKSNKILQIINVGFIEERKNQIIFVAIANELIRLGLLNFHITLVGDGHGMSLLKSEIAAHDLTSYFSFAGWTTDVGKYLADSDIYIHSALNDNCPYSIIEAISKKVPVIAFNVGGIPEIINKEFLFFPNDYKGLVTFLIHNLSNLQNIGEQQYHQISEIFSEKHQFECTKEIYLSLLTNKEHVT